MRPTQISQENPGNWLQYIWLCHQTQDKLYVHRGWSACSTSHGDDGGGALPDHGTNAELSKDVLCDLLRAFVEEREIAAKPICQLARAKLQQPDATGLQPDVLLTVIPILAHFIR